MALFVLCPGAIECLARCDGFVASDCIADSARLGSALVRLIHYMLPDCATGVILVPFYLHAAGVTRIGGGDEVAERVNDFDTPRFGI